MPPLETLISRRPKFELVKLSRKILCALAARITFDGKPTKPQPFACFITLRDVLFKLQLANLSERFLRALVAAAARITLDGDINTTYAYGTFFVVIAIQFSLYFVQFMTPNKSRYLLLATFDIFGFFQLSRYFIPGFLITYLLLGYIYYTLFFTAWRYDAIKKMADIALHHKWTFLLDHPSPPGGQRLARFFLVALNAYILPVILLIMLVYIEFLVELLTDHRERFGVLGLVSFHLNFAVTALGFIGLSYTGIISFLFVFLFTSIFLTRTTRLVAFLARPLAGCAKSRRRLATFAREQIRTLLYVIDFDNLTSVSMLSFIVISTPLSAQMQFEIFFRYHPPITKIVLIFISITQASGFVGIHLLFTNFYKRLRTPFKRVLSLSLSMGRCPLHQRWKVAASIQAFHVKKKYGLTYAGIAVVSMATFFKFLFFYSEFILFTIQHN